MSNFINRLNRYARKYHGAGRDCESCKGTGRIVTSVLPCHECNGGWDESPGFICEACSNTGYIERAITCPVCFGWGLT